MTYSIDLKERVVAFVRKGGSRAEAVQRYKVSRRSVYNWLEAESLKPKKQGRRKRKLDWAALQQDIDAHPDKILHQRAEAFGVAVYSRADFTWCRTAIERGWSVEATATRLMELSTKAKANGERYAIFTAWNAAQSVDRQLHRSKPVDPTRLRQRSSPPWSLSTKWDIL
jgi:transposase